MAALLRDALIPNLVQTAEGGPAIVHAGPFGNIAHGCNSILATRMGLHDGDYAVTEAGFGLDLGGEKFLDIKCRQAGLTPSCAVVVATVRALKMHGGVARRDLGPENVGAVARGVVNLVRHVENLQKFGLPAVVALNKFTSDTPAEVAAIAEAMAALGTETHLCTHWSDGGAGAESLARAVVARIAAKPAAYRPLYPSKLTLIEKIETIAREIYRADGIDLAAGVANKLASYEQAGFAGVEVCIAKTPYSFSSDPTLLGAPVGHTLTVRDVRLSAGAGFVVAVCGDIMTMPGLPRVPAANSITLNARGGIEGLF